jgi:hypothetical protein
LPAIVLVCSFLSLFHKYTLSWNEKSRMRIHSRKMLLRQVHFTQMKMLLSEVSHAD